MILVVFALSLSLSVDSLAAGLSYGARRIRIPVSSLGVIGLISMLIMYLSMSFGNLLYLIFNPLFADHIGVILLLLVGLRLISLALINTPQNGHDLDSEQESNYLVLSFPLRWLGIMIRIIKHPETADLDFSGTIDLRESIFIGLAMSIDSFGVGLAIAVNGFPLITTALSVGFSQVLLLKSGQCLSSRFSNILFDRWNLPLFPGCVIILIALLKLFNLY